ncbi:ABC transporter permease [Roseiarcus sp.]|jgi:ABC-type nitrate/sulfonate/bicarbonate transport system permease component|uniref:ABC transporter permease n=1 Tax=Roseiarcus sp. TaxID=1969460 RepID=UPI003D12C653
MARTSLSVARLPVDPLGIIGLLALVALWWGLSQFHFLSRLALPPPAGVAAAITQNFFSSNYLANYHLGYGGLAGNLAYTISNVVVALAVSCVVGVALGFASARVELFRAFADPIMLTAGTIPILVTAPFFLIWFGTGRSAQIALLILFDVTIVYLFAQRAAANLDPTYVAAGRTLGAGPMRIVSDVYLKGALPEVFGGIRIALAGAWGLEAFSELLGAPKGIGRVIQAMAAEMDSQMVFAAIMTLAAVAVAFDVAIGGAFDFITRWRRRARL